MGSEMCIRDSKRPSFSDIQELVGKGRVHMTDDDFVLLVRNSTPPLTMSAEPSSVGRAACLLNDEPIRIYVPLIRCPCIMQAFHWTAYHEHIVHAGAVRLVDRHGYVHPVVASALLEVSSADNPAADCPLANHLHASPGRSWRRHQCRLLRPSSGHAARQDLHLHDHRSFQSSGRYVPRHCR